jgi:hypothetical protein
VTRSTHKIAKRESGRSMSASLIGRLGSSAFRLSTNSSVDVVHGLSLLFGLGTKALPSWNSKTRWNNLWRDLAVEVTAGSSGHTNSLIHRPARDIIPPWGGARFPPIAFDPAHISSRCDFPGPPEFGAVNPHAVHDHGQPTRQRHDRLLHPAMPGDFHRPRLEPGQ